MKLCSRTQVKDIVESFLSEMYGAKYFSLNDESEDKLNSLFDYYCSEFDSISEN